MTTDRVAQPTRGPWYRDGLNVRGQGNVPVAMMDTNDCRDQQAFANARLIAASPTMLKALKAVLTAEAIHHNVEQGAPSDIHTFTMDDALDEVRAAVRDATQH